LSLPFRDLDVRDLETRSVGVVKMVTVKLVGGLGNQMFQYALGRTIAHRRGTSLALDVSAFPDRKLRQYSLGVFKIVERFVPGGYPRHARLRALGQRLRLPGFTYILRERSFPFDPAVLDAPRNVYLAGYWQSEKYFKEIEDLIRRDFCFKSDPDAQNAATAEKIKAVPSVCVHVRRTDYVTDPSANKHHGTCSLEYYRNAASLIISQVRNPHFFVFSDEPDWARANLELAGPTTFVTHNGSEKGYEDLRLMALCRHHIIANSSFGWWGAWLSNSGGIVVAPKKWFNIDELDTRDLIPERWVRL
jgi:hypothetical protein